jgi:hypothetical protein
MSKSIGFFLHCQVKIAAYKAHKQKFFKNSLQLVDIVELKRTAIKGV